MNFPPNNLPIGSQNLIDSFKSVKLDEKEKYLDLVEKLEDELSLAGYTKADTHDLNAVFNDSSLLCRNEKLSKILDLVSKKTPIHISKYSEDLNLNACHINRGEGFRVALEEGFGGMDINNKLQIVLSFSPENIREKRSAPVENPIWQTKPRTAKNSIQINGDIKFEDIRLISIRIPKSLLPSYYLENYEGNPETNFIVRHYINY